MGLSMVAAAACGTSSSDADDAALCSAVARAVVDAGLSATPSQAQAARAGKGLDPLVRKVADPALHDQVVQLHAHLHAVDVAHQKGDGAGLERATGRAREDAMALARRCERPAEEFVGR